MKTSFRAYSSAFFRAIRVAIPGFIRNPQAVLLLAACPTPKSDRLLGHDFEVGRLPAIRRNGGAGDHACILRREVHHQAGNMPRFADGKRIQVLQRVLRAPGRCKGRGGILPALDLALAEHQSRGDCIGADAMSCTGTSSCNDPPAQFTSTSSLPNRSTVRSMACRTLSLSVTSVLTNSASPPCARTSCSVLLPVSWLISAKATRAPSRAKASALAFAMPAPAPVMKATFPSSLPIGACFIWASGRFP